jgi:hypothetical protein
VDAPATAHALAESPEKDRVERIRVVTPFRKWSLWSWLGYAVSLSLGGAALFALIAEMWSGIREGGGGGGGVLWWYAGIAPVALGLWWLLFGSTWWSLLSSIRRGGSTVIVFASERGLALAMDDEGKWIRQFFNPTLRETADELIIENDLYYMVATLPKSQVPPEQTAFLRRCIHLANQPGSDSYFTWSSVDGPRA